MIRNPSKMIVAAFDFDHTLIDRDSLLPFLFFTTGWPATVYRLIKLIPDFLGFSFLDLSRQAVKESLITQFFKGQNKSDLQEKGTLYADTVMDRFIKPKALARLKWHQEQGHYCILISASVDLYLTPWAQRHGIDKVISSRLEVDSKDCVTGKLIGKNCWGEEKRARFLKELGPKENYLLYVYGDSRGDKELLELADYPHYRTF